jgi:hypothetical protein
MVGGSLVVFFFSSEGGAEEVVSKRCGGRGFLERARLGSRPDAERTSGGRTNAERLLARLPSKERKLSHSLPRKSGSRVFVFLVKFCVDG